MDYIYYPGCSLESSAKEYDISTRSFMAAVGARLFELEDWTCCGASAAEPISELLSLSLGARNLALAEKMGISDQMLVPCSACYLNLKRVEEKAGSHPGTLHRLNEVLDTTGLQLKSPVKIRHLLDVIVNDIGAETIKARVKNSLSGMTIAPYYGCQCLRPYAVFDNPEKPETMDALITATGADLYPWSMGGKCCGASNMNTKMEAGIVLVSEILMAAGNADAIVTVCPMCQMNLESWQKKASKYTGNPLYKTILYLPQFLGLAMDLGKKALGLDLNLAVEDRFKAIA